MEVDIPNLSGSTIGHWKLGSKLGQGGFGTVYSAENLAVAGRRAAVKVLHPHLAADESLKQRFINEASAASRAEHENIIQVFDGGVDELHRCYLVTELLQGKPLGEVMRDGRLEPPRAIGIAIQIARALHSAHRQGIVHRDLKPDNVFITVHDDNPEFVKVLDFGVARLAGARATRAGTLLGTPAYMSPEQWEGSLELDGRSDIYALGVMLYGMLAGQLPFSVKTDYDWMIAHQEKPVPVEPIADVAPELRALTLRMLAKRSEDRPASMQEVARELEHLLHLVHPIETFTISPAEGREPPAPRERWLIEVQSHGTSRLVPVTSAEFTIGSRKGNLLRLDTPEVAPWHARLVRVGNYFFIEDRGSASGTLLAGKKIEGRVPVTEIDIIKVGGFELRLRPGKEKPVPEAHQPSPWRLATLALGVLVVTGGVFALRLRHPAAPVVDPKAEQARLQVEIDRATQSHWNEVQRNYVEQHLEAARAARDAGKLDVMMQQVGLVLAVDEKNVAAKEMASAAIAPVPAPAPLPVAEKKVSESHAVSKHHHTHH